MTRTNSARRRWPQGRGAIGLGRAISVSDDVVSRHIEHYRGSLFSKGLMVLVNSDECRM